MKKTLNLRRLIPAALLLSLILACGSVFAYMFMRTDSYITTFSPAQVSCDVSETFDGSQKSSITVKNTGNIPAYLRVRLVSYWVDGEGNVVPKDPPDLSFTVNSGWIKGVDHTYYYTEPVEPNDDLDLLASPIELIEQDGYRQCVDVFAEAIQAEPAAAVTESWNVTLDSGNTITG